MIEIINEWKQKLDNNETITIAELSNVFTGYSNIEVSDYFPAGFLFLENWIIDSYIESNGNEDIVLNIFTNGVWSFCESVYILHNIDINLKLYNYSTSNIGVEVVINGNLKNSNLDIDVPVSIQKDPQNVNYWVSSLYSSNSIKNFNPYDFKIFTGTYGSEYLSSMDPQEIIEISNFDIIFSDSMEVVEQVSVRIKYSTVPLIEAINLLVQETYLIVETDLPCTEKTIRQYVEGELVADSVTFPLVAVHLPDYYSNMISINMIDSSYLIEPGSLFSSLFNNVDLSNSFPIDFNNLLSLELTIFNLDIDSDCIEVIGGKFVVKPNVSDSYEWNIFPDLVKMKNIGFGYEFNPVIISLNGIVSIGNLELPMVVSYEKPEETALPTILTFELDKENYSDDVVINLADFSIYGFEPFSLLPGFESFNLLVHDYNFEFITSEPIYLRSVEAELSCIDDWTIFPNLNIGDLSIIFTYYITDSGEKCYDIVVYGVIKLNITGTDDIPVMLSVNSEEECCLQLATEDSNGVALTDITDLLTLVGVSTPDIIPDFVIINELRLVDFLLTFSNLNVFEPEKYYISVIVQEVLSLTSLFSLTNLTLNLNFDFLETDPFTDGIIACTFTLGDLILPVLMPLPFNEHEWTLQLDSPAQLPSLSYFSGLAGFDANNLLAELTGFSGIPGIIVSRFDIKFDTDPYKTRKLAIAADFSSSVSITLPPGLEARLDSLSFEMDDESGELALQNFTAYGAVVETIGKTTTLPVQLTRTPTTWEMAINTEEGEAISIDGKFFDSITPGLPLPSSLDDTGFDITGIHMLATHDMELLEFSVYTTITSPNAIFGLDIFIDEIPIRIIYDNSEAEGRWGIQVLEWPFNTGGFKYLQREGWILLDLWEFGAIKLKLPTFYPQGDNFILNGALETTHDGEEVILQNGETFTGKDLNIPVKALFDKMGLSFLNSFFPDRIPLTPSVDLRETIRDLNGDPDNLPDAMQDYLDIEVPDSAEFDVFISSSGDVSVKVKIFQEELDLSKPVKIIMPAGAFVVGIKVFSIGFTYIKGVPFFTIDAEMDLFVTILLIALTWFDVDQIPPLPNFKKVHTKFSMLDVWFLLATGFPLPLFYDELSVHYFGLEGINAGSVINLPKPMPSLYDFSVIGNIMTQLKKFLTEKDYFLDEDEFTFGGADLEFTMGPQFIELPAYVGDPTIGTKDNVFTQSISDILCHILNTLKDPSLSRFFKLIPQEYRYKDMDIEFGPMELKMAVGFTTPLEFYTENPTGFSRSLMNHLFPDLANETLITAGDSETELPEPRHYLQCSENTGSVITDRITGMQLAGDDCKTLNWQREDIKGYRDRIYIQSSSDADLTSIVCGDLIDEPYAQYTITFLAKIDTTVNGCLLSSSGEVSVWYYDGYFESCGGVCAADASVMENTWVRVTLVQSDTGQSIYVDRDLAGQKDIVQTLGTRRMIIGALNEEITVDLPATDGVYQGGYTGIAVYDQALTEIHINQLCDMDEGKIETDKVNKDDSILALLAGSWELGSVVSTQLMLGMSMEGLSAAGLHVAANGSLGDNFLGFDFRGVCQVDAENKDTPFLIDLEGGIYLLGKKVVECAVEFDIDHFYFKGEMDLFDWSFLTVKGEVEGSLNRSGDLLLTANENIIIAGLEVSSAVKITNSSIKMDATLLAVDFTFESSISRNNLYLEASADFGFAIDEKIDAVIPTPFGDITLPTIDVNFGFDAALSIKISQSGLQVKASTGFEFLGRNWSITINLPGIPLDQSALESDMVYAIINEIMNSIIMGVPGALETFTEWAKIAWSEVVDFTEQVAKVLKNAFSKTYNEVANILRDSFDLPYNDIAEGLYSIGANVAQAGEALVDAGCDAVESTLKFAGYAPSAVDDFLSDLFGCCIVKAPW